MAKQAQDRLLALVNWIVDKRIAIFVFMCLFVHLCFVAWFFLLQLWPCVILNVFSSALYAYFGLVRRKFAETDMVVCYFEILIFATINIVMLGTGTGFEMYILGMATVLFLFVPNKGHWRYLYMVVGFMLLPLAHDLARNGSFTLFDDLRVAFAPHLETMWHLNFVISVFTIMGAIFLFSQSTRQRLNSLTMLSNTDSLTGLRNRRALEAAVKSLEGDYALAMLDIDDFKKCNDRFGHDVGDLVLQTVTTAITKNIRAADIASRWGGEEFVVCLASCPLEPAQRILDSIRSDVETLSFDGYPDLHVTLTAGLALAQGRELREVVQQADRALYQGKNSGKNCVVSEFAASSTEEA